MDKKAKILKNIIEAIILPKYPNVNLIDVNSEVFGVHPYRRRYYNVFFSVEKKYDYIKDMVDGEINNLFKISALDEKEFYEPNKISIWWRPKINPNM